ncbi:MAG TPA: hypothetical protein VKB59_02525, partial [Micromonosporaceae bacterium]|nr:hypothetical protein [Micromonosporaceae bacterium]
ELPAVKGTKHPNVVTNVTANALVRATFAHRSPTADAQQLPGFVQRVAELATAPPQRMRPCAVLS